MGYFSSRRFPFICAHMRRIWVAFLLLLHGHAAFCNHQEIAQLDTEIGAMKASLELQQARLLKIEAEAQLVRQEIRGTSRKLEFLGNSRKSLLYNVRLEPVLIAPNSDFPQHVDFIYVGLHLVFCVPNCGSSCNSSCSVTPVVRPGRAQSCDEMRLHVLEKLHFNSEASSSTQAGASALGLFGHPADEAEILPKDRVLFSVELGIQSWQHEAPSGAVSVSDFNAHLCVVLPEQDHMQYQAAAHVIGNFRCRNETFDPKLPWVSAHRMPFHDFRQRLSDGFRGKIVITVNSRVHARSPYAPLLGGTFSRRELVCSITLKPNLCDDESLNLDQISSPLFSSIEYSGSWDFKAPASAASAMPNMSFPCSVAVVWTFWSDPPPFEMDWLSELIDLSGCSVTHWLDLQMRCRGSVFSDSTFTPDSVPASKVFVVSYFPKDFARGLGAMESCMAMWKLDGFAAALVHFGDDGNLYSYLRYSKLDFVIRNHPRHETSDLESFINVIPLGLGYKIKFWPSALRNISLRHRFVDALTVSHRKFSVSFAGQLTAKSRNRAEWVRVAGNCRSVGDRSAMFKETMQFNDPAGLATDDYRQMLLDSVWVLCPGGFVHPETFRFYETLEAGALPILQTHLYWLDLFAHELPPFPLISEPGDICNLIEMSDADAEALRLAAQAWYRRYKLRQARSIRDLVTVSLFL